MITSESYWDISVVILVMGNRNQMAGNIFIRVNFIQCVEVISK
jgi:hypothetical protein